MLNMLNILRFTLYLASLQAAGPAAANMAGDPVRGQQLFSRCAVCHSVEGTNPTKLPLNGVIGRQAASVEGYSFSIALSKSRITWTVEALSGYLEAPAKAVPGTYMTVGVPRKQDRADIIAYLTSLGGQ